MMALLSSTLVHFHTTGHVCTLQIKPLSGAFHSINIVLSYVVWWKEVPLSTRHVALRPATNKDSLQHTCHNHILSACSYYTLLHHLHAHNVAAHSTSYALTGTADDW